MEFDMAWYVTKKDPIISHREWDKVVLVTGTGQELYPIKQKIRDLRDSS
jgi:hypothetical protein